MKFYDRKFDIEIAVRDKSREIETDAKRLSKLGCLVELFVIKRCILLLKWHGVLRLLMVLVLYVSKAFNFFN